MPNASTCSNSFYVMKQALHFAEVTSLGQDQSGISKSSFCLSAFKVYNDQLKKQACKDKHARLYTIHRCGNRRSCQQRADWKTTQLLKKLYVLKWKNVYVKDTIFIYKSISLFAYKGSGKMYQNAGKAGTKMRTCT